MNAATILVLMAGLAAPEDARTFKYRVTGLFNQEREADLREAVKKMTGVEVVSIDAEVAEVTFSYDPATFFEKGTKEKDYLERFDGRLRQASSHTFSAKPLLGSPREKLVKVEIEVVLPDCKGCCLGVTEILVKVEGVAQATADLKAGRVTVLIDPEKTTRAALQEVLKKREVKLKAS